MEPKYISLIIIIAFFLFLIFILVILSWKYQVKHEPYRQARNKFLKEYQEHKAQHQVVHLEVVETNISLPSGENFYLVKKNLNYYEESLKRAVDDPKNHQWVAKLYNLDYDLIEEKNNYSLSNRVAKYYQENLSGDLLVTNKRILLKEQSVIKELKFTEIQKIAPIIFTIKKNFFFGIIIYTKEKLYRIINNDLQDVFLLETLWEKNKKEK